MVDGYVGFGAASADGRELRAGGGVFGGGSSVGRTVGGRVPGWAGELAIGASRVGEAAARSGSGTQGADESQPAPSAAHGRCDQHGAGGQLDGHGQADSGQGRSWVATGQVESGGGVADDGLAGAPGHMTDHGQTGRGGQPRGDVEQNHRGQARTAGGWPPRIHGQLPGRGQGDAGRSVNGGNPAQVVAGRLDGRQSGNGGGKIEGGGQVDGGHPRDSWRDTWRMAGGQPMGGGQHADRGRLVEGSWVVDGTGRGQAGWLVADGSSRNADHSRPDQPGDLGAGGRAAGGDPSSTGGGRTVPGNGPGERARPGDSGNAVHLMGEQLQAGGRPQVDGRWKGGCAAADESVGGHAQAGERSDPSEHSDTGGQPEARAAGQFRADNTGKPNPGGDEPSESTSIAELFGDRRELARRYADLLADTGVSHGLIGPKEGDRVWQRHILNCAVLSELIEPNARVLDMGSGAGLPGIPLALARPDLEITLLEPLERRVDWLRSVLDELALPVAVARGRAEERSIRKQWSGADVVTARAVAPLARLTGWALPLLRPGGRLLAIKGASAAAEVIRDRAAVHGFGGSAPYVVQCGGTHVDPPTTVVVVELTGSQVNLRGTRRMGGRQR